MKTLAYTVCHYGKEYLWYSLKSVADHVDHIIILYSEVPTYGHAGTLQNPDTKEEIKAITDKFNCEFIDVTGHNFSRENDHRGMAFNYARRNDYQIVVAVDFDEIWEGLDEAIDYAKGGSKYQYGIAGSRWRHFFRSFNEINTDGFYPIRLFNLSHPQGSQEIIEKGWINHFGYAISERLMRYKLSVHGHASEIPDKWFNLWLNYDKETWDNYMDTSHEQDVDLTMHPASRQIWLKTSKFDKRKLPLFMRKHPYYGL